MEASAETMKSNRDEFPESVRRAVALRAQYRCSFPGCPQITVGPSEESSMAVTRIGVAAHIHAASPGGKRYLESMTVEQRAGIDNAVWMCVQHSVLIDQDEAVYTAEKIRAWKSEHEARIAAELLGTSPRPSEAQPLADLIAIGPELVGTGDLVGGTGTSWQLRLDHFVSGDVQSLIRFGETFESLKPADRYVLINSLGDGRVIARPPVWKRVEGGYIIDVEVMERFPRERAQDLGADLALGPDRDLVIENGDFATVSGIRALPQKIRLCLWHQRGELTFHSDFGSRLGEYYRLFRQTPWLERLIKLEAVRLASIPYKQSMPPAEYTPFQCVDRVISVELLAPEPTKHWIPARIELEVVGLGRWKDDIPLYIPEPPTDVSPPPSRMDLGPR